MGPGSVELRGQRHLSSDPLPNPPLAVPRCHQVTNSTGQALICQVKFPSILKITAQSPADFQDVLRERYPLYSESSLSDRLLTNVPKEFADIMASLPSSVSPSDKEYRFASLDEKRLVSLGREFLAYSETKYVRWSLFRAELELAEKALRDVYAPAFYSRIGLRYRDVINKSSLGLGSCSWYELLNRSFVGELGDGDIGDEVQEIRTLSLIRLAEVDDAFVQLQHGLVNDPDSKDQTYVIDADFHIGKTELDDALPILDIFNTVAARLFRWSVGPRVREALGPTATD